jgi:3-oxoacyl-[acyl-carrier protein] reductase
VTGGSRGVGRAIVRSLASSGYAVVVDYVHEQRTAEATVEMVLAEHGMSVAVRADVTDDLDVARLFDETDLMFGGIDVVVHAVGRRIVGTPVAEADLDEFDALYRLNTRAVFMVNRQAARHVRRGGAIVNLSSSVAEPHGLYTVTKLASDLLTKALAVELRERDITVNTVSLEASRPCAPHRVADIVTYLVSTDARHLTGQTLQVGERDGEGVYT